MILGVCVCTRVCWFREKEFRLPGNGKRRTLTSGDYRGPTRADSGRCVPVRPLLNRTEDDAKVAHTRRYTASHTRRTGARYTSLDTHVRQRTLKRRMRTPWYYILLWSYCTLLHRRKERRGKKRDPRKRERERERERVSAYAFFPFSLLSTFTSFISCVPRSRDVSTEYRPRGNTFPIVSVHRLLLVHSDTLRTPVFALRSVLLLSSRSRQQRPG